MKRILNLGSLSRIVEGDPNEVTDNEILVIRDKTLGGKILDVQKRINGKMTSLITQKYIFTINPTPADATVTINDQATKSIMVTEGSTVHWSVEKVGYNNQEGEEVVYDNIQKDIVLTEVE